MSRKNEIAQGLRDEDGGLVGGLVVEDCIAAQDDFEAGRSPPRITSASYDVWRARLAREADETAEVLRAIGDEQRRSRERMRRFLAETGHLEMLAAYDAQMAEIDRKADQ